MFFLDLFSYTVYTMYTNIKGVFQMEKVNKVVSARLSLDLLDKLEYMRKELESVDNSIDRDVFKERTDSDMIKYAIRVAYDYCKDNPL